MKVFVFGGTGFIGSRVVKSLVSAGHEVSAPARTPETSAYLKQLGGSAKAGDLDRPETLREAVVGSDVIVNLATPSFLGRIGERRLRDLSHQKLQQTKNLMEAVAEAGDIPIILSEGILVFGDSGPEWVDETAPYDPRGFARIGSPATEFAIKAVEEKNLRLIRMLPGGVYGAGSWFKESVYRLVKRGWFRVFGDGQNVLSYVHVDDVAEAYRLAAERLPVGEAIALIDDEPTKTMDFANFVAEQVGRPPVKSLPKWVGAIAAGGVVAEALTINCKVRNRKAKELLGWRPKYPTYREGIPAAIAEIERS